VICPRCGYEFEPANGLSCPRCGAPASCAGVSCAECGACSSPFERLRRQVAERLADARRSDDGSAGDEPANES
jgi:predicted amidophosphoribosyltransferase